MSPEAHVVICVAIVIDSSLALGQDWPKPIFHYLTHFLKRVTDVHAPAKLRMAFVGYGTADTMPSPILTKRFFMENPMLLKETMDSPHHFGIGTTNSGGSRGMAILDALVAVLELFEGLTTLPNTKVVGSYVLHFSAAPADSSTKPRWNDNIMMDDVDWDSLPPEMKKRNIDYNLITRGPVQGRLAAFCTAMLGHTNPSTPWFDLRPQHTFYAPTVSALEIKGQTPGQHAKRASEATASVDRTPDVKRPRLHESPKTTPKSTPQQPPPNKTQVPTSVPKQPATPTQGASQPQKKTPQLAPAPAPAPAVPTPTPQVQPTPIVPQQPPTQQPPTQPRPFPPNFTAQDAYTRLSNWEMRIQQLENEIASARQANATADRIDGLIIEQTRIKESHTRMKSTLDAYFKGKMSAGLQNLNPQPPSGAMPSAGPSVPAGHSSPPNAPGPSPHNRNLSNTGSIPATTPTLPPAIPNMPSSQISVQMQKLIEQKQKSQQSTSGLSIASGGVQQQQPHHSMLGAGQVGLPPDPGSSPFAGPSMAGPSQPPAQQPAHSEWSGVLKWSGTNAGGTTEMQCSVSVSQLYQPEKALVHTWPSVMVIIPTQERFHMNDLLEWIKKHQPCLAMFKPGPGETDQTNYKTLTNLLVSKHTYATSSWPNTGGQVTRNIIFFPQQSSGALAGAIFPATGLPQLPKNTVPTNLQQMLSHLPPQMLQALQAMPPEQRQPFMARIMQQQMLQQQQAAAAAQLQNQAESSHAPPPAPPPQTQMGHNNNLMSALNTMAGAQGIPHNPMVNNTNMGMNMPGGMPQNNLQNRLPGNQGNMPGNFNIEMFQSFVHRNADGGVGPKS